MQRSLSLEWLCMATALLALTLWLSGPQQLVRANLWLQDLSLRLHQPPASPDVVLVLVDERSLASIGRWPWRRALHAHVIQHISAGQPQSIGLDFLLAEPDLDYPEDDLVLAESMAHSGRVVLPVVRGLDEYSATLPLPLFTQAAARLGHVHVPLDEDGGVRRFYAREGLGPQPWLYLGLSMLCVTAPERPDCQATQHKAPAKPAPWQRQGLMHIALAQGQPPFAMYAYIDVLRGQIPASAFRNKHVVIGTAAAGLGMALATPTGPDTASAYHAQLLGHILSGAQQNQHTTSASPWANRWLNMVPVALGLAALWVLGPSAALLTCAGLALLTLLVHMAAPALWHTSFSPAAALLALTLAYPLWSWRRLNAAARFLNQEMQGLRLQGLGTPNPAPTSGDFLQHRIAAVEQASQQLRQLHQFVTETLLQLPSPTLACNPQGAIVLANSAAHRYAHSLGRTLQVQQPIADLLEGAMERGSLLPLWDRNAPPPLTQTIQREGIDVRQNSLLMLAQPFTVAGETGWLVSLVDISALRQAMAQRDQAMHFISHDIRAPISAILTVIEMEQHFGEHPPLSPSLLERIQRYARSGLALADDFVHLARAQNTTAQRAPVELGAIIDQALDDTWAAAHERLVELDWMPQEEEAWVLGDASMLRRACVNLLSNTIKYGPIEGTVSCSLALEGSDWCITVRDQGEGISPCEQERLFAPFTRQAQHESSSTPGIGLGLAYVHTVAVQHGGSIRVHSAAGHGTSFTLRLPQASAAA